MILRKKRLAAQDEKITLGLTTLLRGTDEPYTYTNEPLLDLFKTSELMTHLHMDKATSHASLDAELCTSEGFLDLLYRKSVCHAAQQREVLRALFQCNFGEGLRSEALPLIAHKDTLVSDVERVTATLLLTRLLDHLELVSQAIASTEHLRCLYDERKIRKTEQRTIKKKLKKVPAAAVKEEGKLSHEERFLVRCLLATSPSWDSSCLRIRRTFLELPSRDDLLESLPLEW
jgi:hypothetical protein